MKQATGCQCMSSHCLHPLIGFEVQTHKHPPTWFWGPNQESVTMILSPKSPNQQPWFWGPNQETVAVVFRPNHWQTVATSFEAKPENSCFSSPPRVWCESHMVSPELLIVRPLSTDLCLITPEPPHQVSYSCLDLHRCPPCRIRHLHITRQANMFLHTK
jgi:hypothetical protein